MRILLSVLLLFGTMQAAAGEPAWSAPYRRLVRELLKGRAQPGAKIGVANFAYPYGRSSGDGGVVSERITVELVKLGKFKVTERRDIEKVLGELKLQASGAMDQDSIKSLGKTLGADLLVLGTLTELPRGRLEVTARLVGVESGEIVNAASAKLKKDWKDQPGVDEGEGESTFRKTGKLDDYDREIHEYMDKKAGDEKHTIKEPPPSFQ